MKVKTTAVLFGASLIVGGVALSATPFGGDDTGFIPSDSPKGPITKCENKVSKAVAKLAGAINKCHASRASGKFTDDAGENACETSAKTKFGATSTTGCTPCVNLTTIGAAVEGLTDANNNKVYCTSTGTAFGGDDTGKIPADAPKGPITKCENGVGKAVGTLVTGIGKCHASRASGKLTDDAMENACEGSALAKFHATKTAGCDTCTNLTTLGSFVETTADSSNALVYCASPSGAFLDGNLQ